MGMFDFFADKGFTYKDIERRQALVEALAGRAAGPTPTTFGGGLAALGAALGSRMGAKRVSDAEAQRVEEANKRFAAALGAPQPSQGFTVPGYEPSMSPVASLASSAPSQPTFNPDGSIGRDLLVQGLVQRGLPEHVAEGFAMNAEDESGFNPGINEIAPVVPGSRGGFGLMQWTGPRRTALEGFAAQTGRPVSDPNLQMDFLVSELQGPERKAASAILSAPDAGTAGAAIVNQFLRPAAEHRQSRAAEYLGGAVGGGTAGSAGGMAPITVSAPAVNTQLLAAMSDPFLDPEQKQMLGMLFQSQQAMQMTPYQQAQLAMEGQKHALAMQQAQAPTKPLEINGQLVDPTTGAVLGDYRDEAGGGGTEYGLSPQYGVDAQGNPVLIQIGKDGTATQTAMPEGVQFQKEPIRLDAGTHWVLLDPITRQPVGQVQKDLAEAEAQKAAGAAQGEAQAAAQAGLSTAVAKADQAIALLQGIRNDPALPGITGMFQGRVPPATQAGTDLNVRIEQAKGQVFLEAFQSLKGGGAITELEGKKAEQAIARMDRAQSTGAYQAALDELVGVIEGGKARAVQKAGQAPAAAPAGDGWQDVAPGVRIREKR